MSFKFEYISAQFRFEEVVDETNRRIEERRAARKKLKEQDQEVSDTQEEAGYYDF